MKEIKLKDYFDGEAIAIEEVSHSQRIVDEIIKNVEEKLSIGDFVVLDFDKFSPKNHFSTIGLLAYYTIYKWDQNKVFFNNMSSEALDYYISSVSLYNKKEQQLNQQFIKEFNEYVINFDNLKKS